MAEQIAKWRLNILLCVPFACVVGWGFKLIVSCVLLPLTEARPYPKKQIVSFELFSTQASEINYVYVRPWPAAARRQHGISESFSM